ncbi:SGNH/GDSL hydrolase family protein [Cellulophaga omnivescoria]|uniref:SGNH/GDSL hydrolase family protein n=1 Tax=Cellulophaga omnivescoria TaxID=1888890 RepID=UPI00098765F0|nr:G-D-S-L family lipolytic protein [Cellulophaga omnivescoria]
MKTKYIWLVAAMVAFSSCSDDDDSSTMMEEQLPELTAGSADFTNYISVGASFTAGYTDGALFKATQEMSFPNILSQKFAIAGGSSAFSQPLTNDNFGGLALNGDRIADPRLVFGGAGPVPLETAIGRSVTVTTDVLLNNPTGPFQNMGVPGAKSFHLLANGYGNISNLSAGAANPYFVRMTGSTPDASVLELAVAQSPTFFTLSEVGGNDVLGFAVSGGSGVDQTGNPDATTYGPNDITDPGLFQVALTGMVDVLTANGAQGAVANVPYITSLPHFTTVPHNPLPMDEATATQVNNGYAQYNGGLQTMVTIGQIDQEEADARTINFVASSSNAVVIEDEDLTDLSAFGLPSYRHATAEDLLVLPASSFIGTRVNNDPTMVNGVSVPLGDKWVLVASELASINAATDAYNAAIATVVSSKGLALVDLNSVLSQASETGVTFDDYTMNTDLVFGGLVSLDGIHLTSRGYALMANKFLEAIDATYGSNFVASKTLAKAANYPTTFSPSLQ